MNDKQVLERDGRTAPKLDETILDTKGLCCPIPLLKVTRALIALPAGGQLRVLATDPLTVPDFTAFCAKTGHQLLESIPPDADGTYSFLIKKQAA